MEEQKKIVQIYVDQIGCFTSEDGEIEHFNRNGEMARVDWYRQGNKEFNGKYVIMIKYNK